MNEAGKFNPRGEQRREEEREDGWKWKGGRRAREEWLDGGI